MKLNTSRTNVPRRYTHEGAPAARITPKQELERSVLSCLLWENTFYENGRTIADRIEELVEINRPGDVMDIAIRARQKMHLRHVPLLICSAMLQHDTHRPLVAQTLYEVTQRPDELGEFLSIYWRNGRKTVPRQARLGLQRGIMKFNKFQLSKYQGKKSQVSLRDVLRITHPKPQTRQQSEVWKSIIDGTLEPPNTWEVRLSSGEDKGEVFQDLMRENQLGVMAFLRNLRNMTQAGVAERDIRTYANRLSPGRTLPFRFITAARYAPWLEPELENLMLRGLENTDYRLPGHTVLLVDVSGSMEWGMLSGRSEVSYLDAACGLGIITRELCENVDIYTFSDKVVRVAPRRGFSLRDAIKGSQGHHSTNMGEAVRQMDRLEYDRLIVITDEQSHDRVSKPHGRAYCINVASNKNGVSYRGWNHIDGFSDNVIRYIAELETANLQQTDR